MFDYSAKAIAFRRKLMMVPLALHITLAGCAGFNPGLPAVPGSTGMAPAAPLVRTLGTAVVVTSAKQGPRAISIKVKPSAFNLKDVQHRWVANDVVFYRLTLKKRDGGNWVALDGLQIDLQQKGGSPATELTFQGLESGFEYRVEFETWGNKGGDPNETTARIDGQNPQSGDVDFTATNDVEDTATVSFTPRLDSTAFNGQIGVSIGAPEDGSYTTTLSPTFSVVTSSASSSTYTATSSTYTSSSSTYSSTYTSFYTSVYPTYSITLIPTTSLSELISTYTTTSFVTSMMPFNDPMGCWDPVLMETLPCPPTYITTTYPTMVTLYESVFETVTYTLTQTVSYDATTTVYPT